MSNFKTIRIKLKPTQVTLENKNRNKNKFKVEISVSEQDYEYLPKKWSYGEELEYGVEVDCKCEGYRKEKEDWCVSVEKDFLLTI
jgi:hypothetical protein